MQFVCFHLMPWPYLPDDFEAKHESAWLTVPNSLSMVTTALSTFPPAFLTLTSKLAALSSLS